MRDPVLAEALSRKGAVKSVAEACGITPAAVCQWTWVPRGRLEIVARVLGVTAESLQRKAESSSTGTQAGSVVDREDRSAA